MGVVFPILILAVMWLFLVRPQQQRVRAQRNLLASLAVGDEVVTAGGLVGRIVELDDQHAVIEIAPGVTVTFIRAAVSKKVTPAEPAPPSPTGIDQTSTDHTSTEEEAD
jgi:preprotein translocase subunit YajC